MRVSEITVAPRADVVELRARVKSDRPASDTFAPFTLWYRFPPWCAPFLSADNGDPFLAALLVPAMMMGEPLAVPGEISPPLLRRLPDLQAIYVSFDPRLARIDVAAAPRTTSSSASPAANGLFLSLGVDSFYSLLKNLRDHPRDDETVGHLLAIHGFDIPLEAWDECFSPRMLANCERVARETGKTLLPVVTNLRRVTQPLSSWSLSHGAALASVALALDGFLRRILIAASTTYDQLYPWGSHPVLDPLWSTESLTVVHDGCEMGRIDKVRFLAGSRLVLDTLRLCPAYNCGRCIKCLPTMIDLMQAGALARSATLPHEIDSEQLREIFRAFRGQLNVENYQRRLEQLDASGPPDLRDVLTEFLISEGVLPVPADVIHGNRRSPLARFFSRYSP